MKLLRNSLPHPALSLFLFVVWQFLMNEFSAGAILTGFLLAWGIPYATRRFWPNPPVSRRPLMILRLSARVLFDILIANLEVALLILGQSSRLKPAFIEYPLELKSEFAIHILSCIISLTPGTVTTDFSADSKTLLIHGLHVPDQDLLIAVIKKRYENKLKEIFECSNTPS